jgi:hypothetical protein
VPQYGEYAPPGATTPASATPNPYGVPTFGSSAIPAPEYGTRVPSPGRKRRTWDVVITVILLVLGLFGTFLGIVYAGIFADPALLRQALASQGVSGVTVNAGSAPIVLIISHVVLFLAAVGVSIPLLISRRIVVFWIPLVAGVIAAIIFWATLVGVLASDPSIVQHYGG